MRQDRRRILTMMAGGAALAALARPGRGAAQPAGGPAPAVAPAVAHVRGTLTEVAPGRLTIATAGGQTVTVANPAETRVSLFAPAALADIKPGSYVGTAAMPGPDGTLVALEVHIFPERLRGTGDGHRPFYLQPQSTMTNGTVADAAAPVAGVAGRTMTVTYQGGQKTVTIPDGVPIVSVDTGSQALLVPGAKVSITATEDADGALTATRIAVGKDGLMPPI